MNRDTTIVSLDDDETVYLLEANLMFERVLPLDEIRGRNGEFISCQLNEIRCC